MTSSGWKQAPSKPELEVAANYFHCRQGHDHFLEVILEILHFLVFSYVIRWLDAIDRLPIFWWSQVIPVVFLLPCSWFFHGKYMYFSSSDFKLTRPVKQVRRADWSFLSEPVWLEWSHCQWQCSSGQLGLHLSMPRASFILSNSWMVIQHFREDVAMYQVLLSTPMQTWKQFTSTILKGHWSEDATCFRRWINSVQCFK